MKIAIIGAEGLSGSYIFNLLVQKGYNDITLFDKKKYTSCGINPCAWMVTKKIDNLISDIFLNPLDYILQEFDYISINNNKFKTTLKTINKPKLINDMLGAAKKIVIYDVPNINNFDLIIDATGNARRYLPKIENDLLVSCQQSKVHINNNQDKNVYKNAQIFSHNDGYTWHFNIGNNLYHIGKYNTTNEIKVNTTKDTNCKEKILCNCTSTTRATSPFYSLPFYVKINNTIIVGVGEAIGICSPLSGEGIVHSMKSCKILVNNLDDLNEYSEQILNEFYWMKKQKDILDKLIINKNLSLNDIKVLYKTFTNSDLNIDMKTIFSFLQ